MATIKKTETPAGQSQSEDLLLEQRKVKALEKIANSLDALTVWFEEIEKQDWSDRLQYYLYEFHNNSKSIADTLEVMAGGEKKESTTSRPKKDSEK